MAGISKLRARVDAALERITEQTEARDAFDQKMLALIDVMERGLARKQVEIKEQRANFVSLQAAHDDILSSQEYLRTENASLQAKLDSLEAENAELKAGQDSRATEAQELAGLLERLLEAVDAQGEGRLMEVHAELGRRAESLSDGAESGAPAESTAEPMEATAPLAEAAPEPAEETAIVVEAAPEPVEERAPVAEAAPEPSEDAAADAVDAVEPETQAPSEPVTESEAESGADTEPEVPAALPEAVAASPEPSLPENYCSQEMAAVIESFDKRSAALDNPEAEPDVLATLDAQPDEDEAIVLEAEDADAETLEILAEMEAPGDLPPPIAAEPDVTQPDVPQPDVTQPESPSATGQSETEAGGGLTLEAIGELLQEKESATAPGSRSESVRTIIDRVNALADEMADPGGEMAALADPQDEPADDLEAKDDEVARKAASGS